MSKPDAAQAPRKRAPKHLPRGKAKKIFSALSRSDTTNACGIQRPRTLGEGFTLRRMGRAYISILLVLRSIVKTRAAPDAGNLFHAMVTSEEVTGAEL
jgi:hypothetical protein